MKYYNLPFSYKDNHIEITVSSVCQIQLWLNFASS